MQRKPISVYAVKHKNEKIRMESRSGGIFSAISENILENSGVVYGCILNDELVAQHIRATTLVDRNRMRGSKYVQSDLGKTFVQVEIDLKSNKHVLFSGTSCQIAGLKAFLKKDYKNLYTIDIVCHGVPSPMVLKDYLKWQEKKEKSSVVKIDFRNKKDFGWSSHKETLWFEDGHRVDSDVFTTLFYNHDILRPACSKCPYKDVVHPADITIADYWGIEKAAPGFSDNKGVSLVLINTPKGEQMFETAKYLVDYCTTRLEDSMQEPLIRPFDKPASREQFWSEYKEYTFEYIKEKYGTLSLKYKVTKIYNRIKRKIKIIMRLQ